MPHDDFADSTSGAEEQGLPLRIEKIPHDDDDPHSDIGDDDASNSNTDRTINENLCGLLCNSCRRLDLSASRFIIDTAPWHATNEVRNHYLHKSRPVALPSAQLASTTFHLGTLSDLRWRSLKCSFCALVKRGLPQDVLAAFEDTNGTEIDALLGAVLTATWEIDGRARVRGEGMISRTRRLHLRWSNEALGEAYVVFAPSNRYTRPFSDAPSVYPNDSLFLGRQIDSSGKNRALMKSWLDLCRDKHGDRCRTGVEPPKRFLEMLESAYFGVIDVFTLQLTDLPQDHQGYAPYAALSYVWGKGEKYRTMLGNVMRHRTHGGLEAIMHKLPQAIQDAIALVPTLGLRYLWVDSLCIVQDSARSWKLNAYNMDLIYGQATLTICGADGEDGTEGLRAMHRNKHNSAQHTAEVLPGCRLMLTKPPESAIRRTIWDSRAWTFQERLLSPRTLIFVDGRVYFQCRSTGMSEDIVADYGGAGWSLDLVNAPLQILRQVDRKPLWVYNKAVELYTRRALTKSADILAAFSGMYKMLECKMNGPFVFGLPTSHFDLALLWQSERAATRRVIPKEDAAKLSESERDFPSWAWCGWEGSAMLYDATVLDGVFRDVRAWLRNHTWITWHVRDGYGDLRPLWDRTVCSKSKSTEDRWRGYEASTEDVTIVRSVERDAPRQYEDDWYSHEHQELEIRTRRDYDIFGKVETPPPEPLREGDGRIRHHRDEWKITRGEESRVEVQDLFGRNLSYCDGLTSTSSSFASNGKGGSFKRALREFPYKVVQRRYETNMGNLEHPLKPILQFFTHYMHLNLVPPDEPYPGGSQPNQPSTQSELQLYSIADDSGDWCGSIVLDTSWFSKQKRRSRLRHEFIAISDAMRFSNEECATWTYYIPKEREESEWDLFYVLLIEFDVDSWKRVGLGKVFKEAFARAEWKEIVLG
ncbi:heterokaryon incompatibility protein-domain-containing protein [Paraphoma chrysanthemicola]|uniref:Heterokaryon incompatibility protein-domain-containing protein n=1 Tax=Paraphoma chrysanthemicola TaxID=798071 RepID=A0A8K0VTK9_9PLEO|nr:heterokaryon incompatibility protein-domain-containing protein [Paraphoma chrysanthemicola]